MSTQATSRYTDSVANTSDGKSVRISVRTDSYPTTFISYVTTDRESFESIASKVFGDPQRWWEIADINTHVKYPNYITPGTAIRVPSV